jgi:hypothetical protein
LEQAKVLEECQSMPLDVAARGMATIAQYALESMAFTARSKPWTWGKEP